VGGLERHQQLARRIPHPLKKNPPPPFFKAAAATIAWRCGSRRREARQTPAEADRA
jgi:hypothetical protein